MVYAFACTACAEPIGLVRAPKTVSDMNYVAGTAGEEVTILRGPGENAGADSPMPPKKRSAGWRVCGAECGRVAAAEAALWDDQRDQSG